MNSRKLALEALNVPPVDFDDPTGVLRSVAYFAVAELRVLSEAYCARDTVLVDVLDGIARRLEVAAQIAEAMETEEHERRRDGTPVEFDRSEAAQ